MSAPGSRAVAAAAIASTLTSTAAVSTAHASPGIPGLLEAMPLANGSALTVSDSADHYQLFRLDVPLGATRVDVRISGGSGDADLYVRKALIPTETTYDCRPSRAGSYESCSFRAAPGTWFVLPKGYHDHAGVRLVAEHDGPAGPQPGPDGAIRISGGGRWATAIPRGGWVSYVVDVQRPSPSFFQASSLSPAGDVDLYVRYGAKPTVTEFDCRCARSRPTERCVIDKAQAGHCYVPLTANEDAPNAELSIMYGVEAPGGMLQLHRG